MRKLLYLIPVLLFLALPSEAAVAHAKSGQGFCTGLTHAGAIAANCGGTTGSSLSYTALGTGNGILFLVSCAASTNPSTITMTATGWSFTQIGTIVGNATAGWVALFRAYAPNTSAATISVTWGAVSGNCNTFQNVLIDEWTGMDATNFVDVSSGGNQGTSGGCVFSVTPSVNDTAAWFGCNDSVTAVTGGYTKGADDTQQDVAEYKILTGNSGVSQSASYTSSGAFTGWGITIKPVAVAGVTIMPPRVM